MFITMAKTCLRGGDEHRRLQLSQFERKTDHFVYNENCSKNQSGMFKQMHLANKVVPFYCTCTVEGENVEMSRCHVHLLDMYRERMQKQIRDLRPLPTTPHEVSFKMVFVTCQSERIPCSRRSQNKAQPESNRSI